MSCRNHPVIKTPNLDKLASKGVLFTRAYVTDPTCMPSRVTYLTGQYERVHGIGFSSANQLTEKQWQVAYPALLRRAGYYTGFIGKFGVQRYYFRGHADKEFDFWRGHDGWARFFPKPKNNCAIYRDSTEEIITAIMGQSIERFLDSAPKGKPFCLSVSFSAPHGSISGSMVPAERGESRMTHPANSNPRLKDHSIYGSLYRDKPVSLPPECATDPNRHIPSEVLKQSKRKKTYSYDYSKNTCTEHHYRYYQLITGVDVVVGRLVESLKKRGLSNNTVIIFASDHGLLMGEYGMGGKALLYELTTRTPLIVYDPRLPKAKRSRRIEELVISADVAPTILSYAGLKVPEAMQGRNLIELIDNPERQWRQDIFLENLYVGRDNPLIEAMRDKQWKYVRYFENPGDEYGEANLDFRGKKPVWEQLFDLENDPGEVDNRAKDPKYAAILNKLRQRCKSVSAEMLDFREKYNPIPSR